MTDTANSAAVTAAVHGHTYARNLYRSSGGAIDFVWNGARAAAISPEPPASHLADTFEPAAGRQLNPPPVESRRPRSTCW